MHPDINRTEMIRFAKNFRKMGVVRQWDHFGNTPPDDTGRREDCVLPI